VPNGCAPGRPWPRSGTPPAAGPWPFPTAPCSCRSDRSARAGYEARAAASAPATETVIAESAAERESAAA